MINYFNNGKGETLQIMDGNYYDHYGCGRACGDGLGNSPYGDRISTASGAGFESGFGCGFGQGNGSAFGDGNGGNSFKLIKSNYLD